MNRNIDAKRVEGQVQKRKASRFNCSLPEAVVSDWRQI